MKFILKEEYFLNLLSYAIIESNRSELTSLAYEILFNLQQISSQNDFKYFFNFDSFLKQNELYKQKTQLKQIDSNSISKPLNCDLPSNDSKNELTELLNIYEYKLNEKKAQETQMITLLNQYYSNILLAESESKILRDKLRLISLKEFETQKEKLTIEAKFAEINKTHQIYKESNLELTKQNQKLQQEKQKLSEQFDMLKKESEQMEKDNLDAIENLQNALKTEKQSKKDLQTKQKELELKLVEFDKVKKSLDLKKKELETKLQTCEQQLSEKQTLLDECETKLCNLDKDHEKLKSEHEKLKSILSYVKENYK